MGLMDDEEQPDKDEIILDALKTIIILLLEIKEELKEIKK